MFPSETRDGGCEGRDVASDEEEELDDVETEDDVSKGESEGGVQHGGPR